MQRRLAPLVTLTLVAHSVACTPTEKVTRGPLYPKPGASHETEVEETPTELNTRVEGRDLIIEVEADRRCRLVGPMVRDVKTERTANSSGLYYGTGLAVGSALLGGVALGLPCTKTSSTGKSELPCTKDEQQVQDITGYSLLGAAAAFGVVAIATALRGIDTKATVADSESATEWKTCGDRDGGATGRARQRTVKLIAADGTERMLKTDSKGRIRLSDEELDWSDEGLSAESAELVVDGKTFAVALDTLPQHREAKARQQKLADAARERADAARERAAQARRDEAARAAAERESEVRANDQKIAQWADATPGDVAQAVWNLYDIRVPSDWAPRRDLGIFFG
jgi:F0F1-type ATP synthase membrane subunit c/vacuolar-type H+-ATPase subunit K